MGIIVYFSIVLSEYEIGNMIKLIISCIDKLVYTEIEIAAVHVYCYVLPCSLLKKARSSCSMTVKVQSSWPLGSRGVQFRNFCK